MFGDVVRGAAGRGVRGGASRGPRAARHRRGHRPRRRRPASAGRALQGDLRGRHRRGLPLRPAPTARRGDPGGVRLLEGRAGDRLPPDQRHPRRLGHGGQRAADGVRQQGRGLGLRGGLQPRRVDRGAAAVGRLPRQRPGRRRGGRDPQHRGPRGARRELPQAHAELVEILGTLERHYRDMQDVEFTVEEGRLFILQTRAAKRPARAAVRFARDAARRGC